MSAVSSRLPGLCDLLIDGRNFQNPEIAAQAASNVHLPIVRGISAIGQLLWEVSLKDDFGTSDADRATIGDIGCLLNELGVLAFNANVIEGNARYCMQKQGGRE